MPPKLTPAVALELVTLSIYLILELHAARYTTIDPFFPLFSLPSPFPCTVTFFTAFVPETLASTLLFRIAILVAAASRARRRMDELMRWLDVLRECVEELADVVFAPAEVWGRE